MRARDAVVGTTHLEVGIQTRMPPCARDNGVPRLCTPETSRTQVTPLRSSLKVLYGIPKVLNRCFPLLVSDFLDHLALGFHDLKQLFVVVDDLDAYVSPIILYVLDSDGFQLLNLLFGEEFLLLLAVLVLRIRSIAPSLSHMVIEPKLVHQVDVWSLGRPAIISPPFRVSRLNRPNRVTSFTHRASIGRLVRERCDCIALDLL